MKLLTRDRVNVHFLIDRGNPPKISIKPGEKLAVQTIRADDMYLSRENPGFPLPFPCKRGKNLLYYQN